MNILFKKGFTLIEIMVATFIGTIILSFIFIFLGDIVDSISKAKNQVRSLGAYNDFSIKLVNYKNIYNSGSIVVDQGSGTGSDVLMLVNNDKTRGILMGAVDLNNFKISSSNKYYKNLSLGFRPLNAQEISDITLSGSSVVYDFLFFKDNVFPDLIVKDIQLDTYNTGALFDLDLTININYNNGLGGNLWDSLSQEDLLRVNLIF